MRGRDAQGSGEYGASRGNRTHRGIDVAYQASAISPGQVTKIGYPYNPADPRKGRFRYVEITDELGYRVRYFYLDPTVKVNDWVKVGDPIGYPQDLTKIYPGVTPHIHFEIIDSRGDWIDPNLYLQDL
jgi:murein DD-endopeptidase MepM/ murein hydrolase activator NlpD